MAAIELMRTYDARHSQESGPGRTFLVDRLWPRGIAKTELAFDSWLKDIAPSTQLRTWFGHDPAKFDQFRARYRAELDADPAVAAPILNALADGPVRLLFSAKDTAHNQAVVLKEWLLER
ncbi:DUF488 domain-containing protein [Tomitella biformata]|uniref:DUF488 domain-containing protein n=1 Tax=Tomitella biformata TaxID=630403 RepID=UPI00046302B6|nr:DUF488 family protein [Tomitella biformata]